MAHAYTCLQTCDAIKPSGFKSKNPLSKISNRVIDVKQFLAQMIKIVRPNSSAKEDFVGRKSLFL